MYTYSSYIRVLLLRPTASIWSTLSISTFSLELTLLLVSMLEVPHVLSNTVLYPAPNVF